jgi:ribosomal protein S25
VNAIVLGIIWGKVKLSSIRASSSRRGINDDEIVLGVLDAVERNQHITQRVVANELGIALGLANAYLKRCVRKGLVKISEVPRRRYAYYLTPQGFA